MPYKPYDNSKSPMTDFQWDDIQADVLATDISTNSKISGLKQLKTETKIPTKAINALAEQLKNAQSSAADAVEQVTVIKQTGLVGDVDLTQLAADVNALKTAMQSVGTGTSTGEQQQSDMSTRLAVVERRLNAITTGWHAPVGEEEEEIPEGVNITPDDTGFVAYTGLYQFGTTTNSFRSLSTIDMLDVEQAYPGILTGLTSGNQMFYNCTSLTTINNLDKLDTSHMVDMSNMFSSCKKLTTLDLSTFDTTRVTRMSSFVSSCDMLNQVNLANLNTVNVVDMQGMFCDCKNLTSLDLSNLNSYMLTDAHYMFSGCVALENLTFGNNFTTKKVTNFNQMFHGCNNLSALNLTHFHTSNATNMAYMFANCNKLKTLVLGDGWDTSNVTDMSYMFMYCQSIVTINLLNFNTTNTTKMDHMFCNCNGLTTVNFSDGFTIANDASTMFSGCVSLENIDFTNVDMSKVENTGSMFSGCVSLDTLVVGDDNVLDLSHVTDARSMFSDCTSLPAELPFIIDISNITNTSTSGGLYYMFYNTNITKVQFKNAKSNIRSGLTSEYLKGSGKTDLVVEFVD